MCDVAEALERSFKPTLPKRGLSKPETRSHSSFVRVLEDLT